MIWAGTVLLAFVAGGFVTWQFAVDSNQMKIRIAEERMGRAFRECGKLSRKIHKQRLTIKSLKDTQIPKAQRKYAPPVQVSH